MRTWDIHQIATCVQGFLQRAESDGNRREVTSLEPPWRSDKTERAGRDCKEDYYKTRKVFEEDRVTVNQTKASKTTTEDTASTNVSLARILYRWKMPFWNVEEKAQA